MISEEKFGSFIEEFKSLFKQFEPTITLFSLKNMNGKQKFLRFEDNKICITFDYVNNKENLLFMSKIDSLYDKYDIIPSVIKDSRLSKETIKKSYNEELISFKEKLCKFDGKNIPV